MRNKKVKGIKKLGLTLVETIIGMAIVAVAFYFLIWVFINITPRTALVENLNKKVYLAQEKIEEYLARPFTQVTSVGASSFTGNFSDYKYQIIVNYVATNELNTPVAGPTPFKNVKVRVWGGGIEPASTVEITSLVATYEIY
ncbi:MAG: hypothetical protein ABIK67_07965 [candidate division WOR-3 bacterium]